MRFYIDRRSELKKNNIKVRNLKIIVIIMIGILYSTVAGTLLRTLEYRYLYSYVI